MVNGGWWDVKWFPSFSWASSNWEPELSLRCRSKLRLKGGLTNVHLCSLRFSTPWGRPKVLISDSQLLQIAQNSSLKREYHDIGKFSIFDLLQDDYRLKMVEDGWRWLKMVEDGWRWLKYVEVISQIIRNNLLGVEATRSMQLICWWMKFGSWMFSSCCHSKSWRVIEKSLPSLVWKIVFFMTHQPFKLRSGSIKLTSPFNVSLL